MKRLHYLHYITYIGQTTDLQETVKINAISEIGLLF